MLEAARRLIQILGENLDISDLKLDEDGYCCVAFDDVVVNLEFEAERNEFLLFSKVADAPGDVGQRYVEEVLDLSYASMLTGGGCLGLDRAGGAIMFADRVVLRGLDDALFEKEMENYVDRAESWQKLLAGPEFSRLTCDGPKLEEMGSMMRI